MNRQIKCNSCMINYQTDHLSRQDSIWQNTSNENCHEEKKKKKLSPSTLLRLVVRREGNPISSIVITRASEQCLPLPVFSPRHHHQQLIEHIFFFFLIYLDKWRRCTIRLINAWIVPSDLLVFSICVEREIAGWMRIDRDVFDSPLSNWIIFTFPPVVNHNRRAIGRGCGLPLRRSCKLSGSIVHQRLLLLCLWLFLLFDSRSSSALLAQQST